MVRIPWRGACTFLSVDLSHLAPRKQLFVREFAKDLHARNAAIRAGYSERTATQQACNLMAEPEVKVAVDEALAERGRAVQITADDVLRDLIAIAKADPNDIVQHRRLCCRFCWGEGFRYQRTAGEMERDRRGHEADTERRQEDAAKADKAFTPRAFDEQGGVGYRRTREPNVECPECFGEGVEDVHIKDTRLLAAEPRSLYAGVKRTKEGIEVKTHDKRAVLELIGRHLGMFKDKVELSGQVAVADALLAGRRRAKAGGPGSGNCPLV